MARTVEPDSTPAAPPRDPQPQLLGPPRTEGYAAVVFDFDGTLVDTGDINTTAALATLADLHLTVPGDWLRRVPLADLDVLRERLLEDLGLELACSNQAFVTRARAHWLILAERVTAVPAVVAAARRAAGTGPVCVASANDGQVVRTGLRAAGLGSLFPLVVAREDVRRLKPAPDAFLAAAHAMGVAAHRCLVHENTDEGMSAAFAAHMDAIDVRFTPWTIRSVTHEAP